MDSSRTASAAAPRWRQSASVLAAVAALLCYTLPPVAHATSLGGIGTLIGSPPNAILFGSGLITIPRMCKTGVWLNLAAIVVITALSYAPIPMLLRQ